jgi:hypothetical protein
LPTRILHLIDGEHPRNNGGDPGIALRACAAVTVRLDAEHRILLLGGRRLANLADECGLRGHDRLAPPLGRPTLAVRALRPLILGYEPDLLQAWSFESLSAARRAAPEIPRAAAIVDGAIPRAGRIHLTRSAAVGVCGRAAREELAGLGADVDRVMILPAPALGNAAADRARTRAALGLDDETPVLLLLGSAPHADALRFVFLLGLLTKAGAEAAGLLPPTAAQIPRAMRFLRASGRLGRIIRSDRDSGLLLPAADLAVFEGGGITTGCPPPRPAAATPHVVRAMARALPVVLSRQDATDLTLPKDVASACLGVNATLPELARLALPLMLDPHRRATVGVSARAAVAAQAGDDRFAQGLGQLWESAMAGAAKRSGT